jgi:hypothetical protein
MNGTKSHPPVLRRRGSRSVDRNDWFTVAESCLIGRNFRRAARKFTPALKFPGRLSSTQAGTFMFKVLCIRVTAIVFLNP